jgi:hypothetical protein
MQSDMRRIFNGLMYREGVNSTAAIQTLPLHERILNYFRRIFGDKLKYILYILLWLMFCGYALLIQRTEYEIWNYHETINNNNNTTSIPGDNTQPILPPGDVTTTKTKAKSSRLDASWIAFGIIMITWCILLLVLRYIRYVNASVMQRRQQDQLRFIDQLRRTDMPGLATRLRLALMQRDFNGDDYEILQELDDLRSPTRSHGANELHIHRLPLQTLSAADFQVQEGEAPLGNCNICLGPYEIGDEVRTILCMHKFHKDCIDPWLRTKNICPICKYQAAETNN